MRLHISCVLIPSKSLFLLQIDVSFDACFCTKNIVLAVYSRSPSAYEALRRLHILQLPCSKILKNVIKDGGEKPGIDEGYLHSQQGNFRIYQEQREKTGHSRPLGLGVLMWDEVKVF